MKWTGTVPLGEREVEVVAELTITRDSDGDSSVPYGTRSWLEVDEVLILTAEDSLGNAVEGKDEALAEWISSNVDAEKLVREEREAARDEHADRGRDE